MYLIKKVFRLGTDTFWNYHVNVLFIKTELRWSATSELMRILVSVLPQWLGREITV